MGFGLDILIHRVGLLSELAPSVLTDFELIGIFGLASPPKIITKAMSSTLMTYD